MTNTIETKVIQPQAAMSIRVITTPAEIGQTLGQILGEVGTYLQGQGVQYVMTTLYYPSIQEHSSLFVSRRSKYSRTVHVTSIKCRSSNTRFIHLGSATHLQSQSGSKWKSFEMPCQILEVQTVSQRVLSFASVGYFPALAASSSCRYRTRAYSSRVAPVSHKLHRVAFYSHQ